MAHDFPDHKLKIVCSKCTGRCKVILVLAARARCFHVRAAYENEGVQILQKEISKGNKIRFTLISGTLNEIISSS